MKLTKYIFGALALIAAAGFSACQDHFDDPDMDFVPVATMKPNTTIAEVKELMWSDADNYCKVIPTKDGTENGEHIIIAGRVISSDYAGNCFKYIILQDETGCLSFSINSYNLYLQYRRGQEVVVDLTGLYMGKYRGLEQVGFPSFNSSLVDKNDPNNDPYETSFMAPEMFRRNMELNGMPKIAALDTTVVNSFSEIGVTPAELRYWQSRVVRFNNVEFVPNATLPTLSTYHSSGETQQIRDAGGSTLDIRTSGYANFWNMKLPEGRGDVVAIMGYYVNLAGTGGWQLTLIDANSMQNFGNPTVPAGGESNPYSVLQAIAAQVNDENVSGWTKGYIVGTVAPQVTVVSSNADVEWTATPTLGNTLVIGQTPETKDIAECLVVSLPQGSDLRTYGALRENPSNYLKEIVIKGRFASVLGTYGITDNNGSSSEFHIEGVDLGGGDIVTDGDGTKDKPYSCAQVIALNNSGTTSWVQGYIVGAMNSTNNYTFESSAPFGVASNLYIADNPGETDQSKCVPVELKSGSAVRSAMNLVDHPELLGAKVSLNGELIAYFNQPGVKNISDYSINGASSGGDTPSTSTGLTLLKTDATGWTYDNVNLPSAVSYIWQWDASYSNLKGSAYVSGTAYAAESWAVSPVIDLSKASTPSFSFDHGAKFQTTLRTLCGVGVREVGSKTWTMLTIPTWPEAGAWTYVNSGSISLAAFAGKQIEIGFKYGSSASGADTWQINNLVIAGDGVALGTGGSTGGDTPNPPAPSSDYKGDFDSFNGGTPVSKYGTYTNATGWTLANGLVLSGSDTGTDTNPRFTFIGSGTTLAPCLNGRLGQAGVLTSPTLTGGCGTLTFDYGFAFADTACEFTVKVLQGGTVVKSQKVTVNPVEQKKVYNFSMAVNVSGDFQIIIENDCASQDSAKNTQRVAIWHLTWN